MNETNLPRGRLGLVLWVAGALGIAAITWTLLPGLAAVEAASQPEWVIMLASAVQSGLLLALCVWLGVRLGPHVGLRAPVVEALVSGRPAGARLQSVALPGVVAGLVAGLLLVVFGHMAPAELAGSGEQLVLPLYARILYGGVTEELLLRWGLMTLLAWLAWRFVQHRDGEIRRPSMWFAIVVSALLFGVGHLPVAMAALGSLDAALVIHIVLANSVFGVIFGFLFWRNGIEAAVLAHALAHIFGWLATLA